MAQANPQSILHSTLQTMSQQNVAPATGADLIKSWITALKNVDDAQPLSEQLGELYDELINPQPDAARVTQLLNSLANHTQTIARKFTGTKAEEMIQLADSLRSFATDLGGIQNSDEEDGNQPGNMPLYDLQNPGDRVQMLFNGTLEMLGNGAVATTPQSGASLVEDWITAVRFDQNTQWIEIPLTQLRDALQANDMRATERAMRDLAGLAQDYANNYEGQFSKDLTYLATALISFAQPLS
ncbi:hypothetical protein [Spirosoma utsteinense]|uniref:Uncharacterized protein n=1 Tax=Spirosoma utsteinense TaxID=2585773 RepID=A0ABR6W316_9BACT|nr:hypothetical protein [Spirosoma utsteinense]MBC3783722.1 hypothetical protein [Spirosoma utsteinense]MBC3790135.1 hypothetical protein [Spirosoma utsteinense]